MYPTVRNKIDRLLQAGYISRYEIPQIIWERMRMEEKILFKKLKDGKVVSQILGKPDKVGAYFEVIPVEDDYCRFHEEPVE